MPLAEIRQSFGRFRRSGDLSRSTLLQQLSQQPRNARIPARRLDPSPLGDIFFEGYGHIA